MLERNISRDDIKNTILNGEIIESYPDDKPFPSILMFYQINNRPLHVVVAFDEESIKLHIVTTYEPSLDFFESDFKTRKINE